MGRRVNNMLLVGPTRTEMPQTEQRFKQPTEHVSVSQVRRLCPHFTPLNPPPSFSLLSATIQYSPLSSPPSLCPPPPHSSLPPGSVPVVLVWSERAATTAEQAGAIHYHTATISLQRARDTDTYRERERESELQNVTEVSLLSSVICRSIIHISLSN